MYVHVCTGGERDREEVGAVLSTGQALRSGGWEIYRYTTAYLCGQNTGL